MSMRWNKENLVELRKRVKDDIALQPPYQKSEDLLRFMGEQIKEREKSITAESLMEGFFYILSALEQHERHGGLTLSQVESLAEHAELILQSQGISLASSRLSFTYAMIYDVLSLIYKKSGKPWRAAWQQHMAEYAIYSKSETPVINSFQQLCHGNRSLRLGYGTLAASHYEKCLQLSDRYRDKAKFGLIKILWLAGRTAEAREAIQALLTLSPDTEFATEIRWMQLCMQCQESGEFRPILLALRKGSEFFTGLYVAEGLLWLRAAAPPAYSGELAKCENIARNPHLDFNMATAALKCAQELERCYDKVIPMPIRIMKAGHLLENIENVVYVEHELLVLAAFARWLMRNRAHEFAGVVVGRYKTLSLALSNGDRRDALGILAEDLLAETDAA